jgi:hypothetical protein
VWFNGPGILRGPGPLSQEENVKEIDEIMRQRPGDAARVFGLLSRSDALDEAISAVEDEEDIYPETKEETLEVLELMLEEVEEEFERARRDLGLPD